MSANDMLRMVGGGTKVDWFTLSIHDKAELLAMAKRAGYRQSPQQKAAGRSRAYSFYLSLQRKAVRERMA